jgi:hypothetical protein
MIGNEVITPLLYQLCHVLCTGTFWIVNVYSLFELPFGYRKRAIVCPHLWAEGFGDVTTVYRRERNIPLL